jgi:hypothetical protein
MLLAGRERVVQEPYDRVIVPPMFRSRSLIGLLTAELVSLTGSAMTYVALPWFVLVTVSPRRTSRRRA